MPSHPGKSGSAGTPRPTDQIEVRPAAGDECRFGISNPDLDVEPGCPHPGPDPEELEERAGRGRPGSKNGKGFTLLRLRMEPGCPHPGLMKGFIMPLSVSKRSELITQSDIRVMTLECLKVNGVNLAQGVCDTGVPEPVTRGVTAAMRDGFNTYTKYNGLPVLREAIARKMSAYNGITADPEAEITVSAGSTGALYSSFMALLNPGDEVIVFEPYYGYHVNTLLSVDVVPRFVTLQPPDWTFTAEALERAASPRTRGIIVCTPANPSGKVFTAAELDVIAAFAFRHDCFVFTDEIYEYFLYDGRRHISPGSRPDIRDRTITISGYSKTFSITGWRIGYAVCAARWAGMIGYMNDLVYVCAPAPLQVGVAAGINELPSSFYDGLRKEFDLKRDQICSTLSAIGLTPYVPQGSYYVLADTSRLPGADSKARALHLLQKTGVAGVPGSAFFHGREGDTLIRFCFAKTDEALTEACRRLKTLN